MTFVESSFLKMLKFRLKIPQTAVFLGLYVVTIGTLLVAGGLRPVEYGLIFALVRVFVRIRTLKCYVV